jgi:hypothetical protein
MNESYYNPRASGNWPIIKQVACYHRLESGMLEMYYVRYAILQTIRRRLFRIRYPP